MAAAIRPAVIREAAQWLTRLHSGEAGPDDQAAFKAWRERSPEHEQAWQRAQRLSQHFEAIPSPLGRPVLTRPALASRRASLRALARWASAASGYGGADAA
ncbi:FecR/PupR family sigma factor regulator [Bordetella avium]|uniref:FecR/PupR family sigma factor regulator n=1 Tax=Bordetella avium TaxID=521 RepID=UPI0002FA1275|nr:DUF4880 domain-containing protein [Bordetella avium]AZY52551.1 DUF4880 domain-containing protein [Bordetella avium]RIQ48603.1 DUF4880 domain-containing protein [Bordetella avium]RIQ71357.1 DUF4880 domain-containing protein [Bordetella avium]